MALPDFKKQLLSDELKKQAYHQWAEKRRVESEEKGKSRNLMRLIQLQRREQEAAYQHQHDKELEAYCERTLEQEETLARELNELKRKELCAIRERQVMRENCDELKDLEKKLKAAYAKRELMAQIAENEEKRRQEKLRTMMTNKVLEEARLNEAEYEKQMKQMEINKKHQYKLELQNQMIYNEKMKRFKYEEFLREKKLIDQIVERIQLEEERALEEKLLKMQKTKEEMEDFKKAQEIWKQRQREQLEQENKRIQEYMFSKQTAAHDQDLEKQRKEKAKAAMVDKIARDIYEQRTQQKEREDIRQELLQQERIEASDLREQIDLEKRMRQRVEMLSGLDYQIQERERQRQQIAQEDAYYNQMLQKNKEETEKTELMTAEKQRIKKMQLRKDMQELIQERRRKHAEHMQIKLRLHEEDLEEVALRNRKIEEERIRLLKEHAEHLIGYLPKGVLRVEDLPLLGQSVYERYKPKDASDCVC